MTGDRDDVERVRRLHRLASERCAMHGVPADDLAIAALYAAFDMAELHSGQGMAAIEWMRTAWTLESRFSTARQSGRNEIRCRAARHCVPGAGDGTALPFRVGKAAGVSPGGREGIGAQPCCAGGEAGGGGVHCR